MPVWTAFITYQIQSRSWMRRSQRRNIHLRELQRYIFSSEYMPQFGPGGEHELSFLDPKGKSTRLFWPIIASQLTYTQMHRISWKLLMRWPRIEHKYSNPNDRTRVTNDEVDESNGLGVQKPLAVGESVVGVSHGVARYPTRLMCSCLYATPSYARPLL